MKIGFIGLGIMGKPMAHNLIKAGYDLVVNNRSQAAVEELCKAGAASAATAREVAEQSDIIFTMLPNSPDVEKVVTDENGILKGIRKGAIYVDLSSIAPLVSKSLAEKIRAKGADMLDAPVSGGEPKAIDGTLAIMAGGNAESFEKVKPVMEKMAASVALTGEVGSGNTTKLANQIIVALNIAAVSEAFVLATKAGVNPESVYNAIRGGLAGSTVLDAKGPMMMNRNFAPGFRIELHQKDLLNAIETANGLDVPLPFTSQALEVLKALKVSGSAKEDHSAIVKYFEKIADVEVKKN